MSLMTREELNPRRECSTFDACFRGMQLTISYAQYDDGRIAEIFVDTAAGSSDLANDIRDSAVSASLALQHGVTIGALRKSMLRSRNGRPAGVLGFVLDEIELRSFTASNEAVE